MTQSDAYRMIRRRAIEAALQRRSAITLSARRASRNICATAAGAKSRSRWRTMSPPAQPAFMTDRDDEVSLDEVERIVI